LLADITHEQLKVDNRRLVKVSITGRPALQAFNFVLGGIKAYLQQFVVFYQQWAFNGNGACLHNFYGFCSGGGILFNGRVQVSKGHALFVQQLLPVFLFAPAFNGCQGYAIFKVVKGIGYIVLFHPFGGHAGGIAVGQAVYCVHAFFGLAAKIGTLPCILIFNLPLLQ
jgi:hypothetical protein